jgi:hypothetical protein
MSEKVSCPVGPLRRCGRGVGLVALAAIVLPLLVPAGVQDAAVAAEDEPPPVGYSGDEQDPPLFTERDDNVVEIAEHEAPVAFLGSGEQGLSYVAETQAGTAANAFGYDRAVTDPSLFAEALAYERGVPTGREILDVAIGTTTAVGPIPGGQVITATISRASATAPWVASLAYSQQSGFERQVASWTLVSGSCEVASGPSIPGEPVGVVILPGRPDLAVATVVFATDVGLFRYYVRDTGMPRRWQQTLEQAHCVGTGLLPYPPAAIHYDRGFDAIGVRPPALAELGGHRHFVVATRVPASDAEDRLAGLMLVHGDDLTARIGLATSSNVTWAAGEPIQLRYSSTQEPAAGRDVHVGLQAGSRWYRYLGAISLTGAVTPFQLQASYPCDTSHVPEGQRPGFDFAAIRFSENAWYGNKIPFSDQTVLAGVCVAPTVDGDLRIRGAFGIVGQAFAEDEYVVARPEAAQRLTDPQIHLTLPCFETLRIARIPSLSHVDATCAVYATIDGFKLNVNQSNISRIFGASVLAGVDEGAPSTALGRSEVESTALLGLSPFVAPEYTGDTHWALELPADGKRGVVRHIARLPNGPVRLTVELDDEYDNCFLRAGDGYPNPMKVEACKEAARIEDVDAIPFALLAAPPFVAGARQQPDGRPTFARSTTSGGSESETTATRVGFSVGIEVEDPLSVSRLSVEGAYEREVQNKDSTTYSLTLSEAFLGEPEQDYVVATTTQAWVLDGTVLESSTGLGVGSRAEIRHPRSTTTHVMSVEKLVRDYPEKYGATTVLGAGLRDILSHTPGDPGSYLETDADVDQACIGSIDGGQQVDFRPRTGIVLNPFVQDPPPTPPTNAIIVAPSWMPVGAGTGGATQQAVAMEEGTSYEYLGTHSVDVTVAAKAGYLTGSVSGGGTWGRGWTFEVSEGTSFEASVGNIPTVPAGLADDDLRIEAGNLLRSEEYRWRMFLCKQDLAKHGDLGGQLPVWVLGYTVDDYRGSGGLAELRGLNPVGPSGGATVGVPAQLRWQLASGTIRRFDWRIQGITVEHTRVGALDYGSIDEYRALGFPPEHQFAVAVSGLKPGHTHAWQVRATDFFGNQTDWSQLQFFNTTGTPAGFSDVSPDSAHAESISRLVISGITLGCAPGRFCPQDPVTRAQMATFLTRGLDLRVPDEMIAFDDVAAGTTHHDNIQALAAAGITLGCGPGRFCPNAPVTRAQMATFLTRALDLAVPDTPIPFDDVPVGSTHHDSIQALAAAGITLGCGPGRFCPNNPVTRAQMASFLVRALDL